MATNENELPMARTDIGLSPKPPLPPVEPELIGKVPRIAKSANGPLPEMHQRAVEHGLAQYQGVVAERDKLLVELRNAYDVIARLQTQINDLEGTRNTIESRINSCVLERDNAVREAGELRGALNSVAAICVRYHDAQQDQEH